MKPTKNMILATLVAALFAGNIAARAQDNFTTPTTPSTPPPPAGASARPHGPNADYIAKQLDLTDEQKAKFSAAYDSFRQKVRALVADKSLSPEDRRSQMKDLRQDFNTQLKSLLTPDQFAKWEKISTHRRPPVHTQTAPSTNAPPAAN